MWSSLPKTLGGQVRRSVFYPGALSLQAETPELSESFGPQWEFLCFGG